MTGLVCNYAILRFLPYRETGEFVNVGVVLYCPQAGFYDFRCEVRRTARVKGFFPELDPEVFRATVTSITGELARVRETFSRGQPPGDKELVTILGRFRELVRTREGLLQFGAHGVVRTTNTPAQALEELYAQFVLRQFAQQSEYQETVMRRRLDEFLRQWDLRQYYKVSRSVGDERFHITFPFVQVQDGQVGKALKPLDLDRRDPTDIYQHADVWVNALRRLRKNGKAPAEPIFPVHLPAFGEKRVAADEAIHDLQEMGAVVVGIEDERTLRQAVTVEPEKR